MIAGVRQDRSPEIRNRERSTGREIASRVYSIHLFSSSMPPRDDLLCIFILPSPSSNGWAEPTRISPSLRLRPRDTSGVTLEQDDVGADDVVALLGGEVVVVHGVAVDEDAARVLDVQGDMARGATWRRSCDSALKLSAHTERTAPSMLLDGDGS
jgi:hypothetical protein